MAIGIHVNFKLFLGIWEVQLFSLKKMAETIIFNIFFENLKTLRSRSRTQIKEKTAMVIGHTRVKPGTQIRIRAHKWLQLVLNDSCFQSETSHRFLQRCL